MKIIEIFSNTLSSEKTREKHKKFRLVKPNIRH